MKKEDDWFTILDPWISWKMDTGIGRNFGGAKNSYSQSTGSLREWEDGCGLSKLFFPTSFYLS